MTHAGFPSLLSLDLSSDLHTEKSSLRRWTAGSLFLHLIVVLIALNLRFTPEIQQPLSSYEVSLVSLPASKVTAPSPSKSKAAPRKSRAKKAPPKPKEKPLPPLTTKMASERLSESFTGAAKSVVVPDKLVHQAPADPPPVVKTAPGETTALENIKLPSKAPTLERVQPLTPGKPEKSPDEGRKEPKESAPAPAASKPKATPQKPNVKNTLKAIKAPPKAPELASVQPFTKTQNEDASPSTPEPVSQALKEKMKSIQVPAPSKKPIPPPKKRAKKRKPAPPPPTQALRKPTTAKAPPKKELPPRNPGSVCLIL